MKKPKKNGRPQSTTPAGEPGSAPASAPASNPVSEARPEAGSEPTVQRSQFPVLLIPLLAVLIYWGSMYVIDFGGEADARVHYPYTSFRQIEELQPKSGDALLVAKGLLVYAQICSQCHQNDGNGSPSQNAPPLAKSEWVQPNDPSRIIRIVLHGLSGPITVLGREWGASVMTPWKETLNDEQIASVLTLVRNSWGNKAPAVTPEEVKRVRKETESRSGYMTVEDLMKVTLKE